jgi:hypothetical protein
MTIVALRAREDREAHGLTACLTSDFRGISSLPRRETLAETRPGGKRQGAPGGWIYSQIMLSVLILYLFRNQCALPSFLVLLPGSLSPMIVLAASLWRERGRKLQRIVQESSPRKRLQRKG